MEKQNGVRRSEFAPGEEDTFIHRPEQSIFKDAGPTKDAYGNFNKKPVHQQQQNNVNNIERSRAESFQYSLFNQSENEDAQRFSFMDPQAEEGQEASVPKQQQYGDRRREQYYPSITSNKEFLGDKRNTKMNEIPSQNMKPKEVVQAPKPEIPRVSRPSLLDASPKREKPINLQQQMLKDQIFNKKSKVPEQKPKIQDPVGFNQYDKSAKAPKKEEEAKK